MSGNVVSDVLVQHDLESVMSDLHHILSVARKGQVSVLGSSKVGCKGYPKRNPLWVDLLSSARNHSANFSAAKKTKNALLSFLETFGLRSKSVRESWPTTIPKNEKLVPKDSTSCC